MNARVAPLLMALALVACGGDDTNGGASPPRPGSTGRAEGTASATGVASLEEAPPPPSATASAAAGCGVGSTNPLGVCDCPAGFKSLGEPGSARCAPVGATAGGAESAAPGRHCPPNDPLCSKNEKHNAVKK